MVVHEIARDRECPRPETLRRRAPVGDQAGEELLYEAFGQVAVAGLAGDGLEQRAVVAAAQPPPPPLGPAEYRRVQRLVTRVHSALNHARVLLACAARCSRRCPRGTGGPIPRAASGWQCSRSRAAASGSRTKRRRACTFPWTTPRRATTPAPRRPRSSSS